MVISGRAVIRVPSRRWGGWMSIHCVISPADAFHSILPSPDGAPRCARTYGVLLIAFPVK